MKKNLLIFLGILGLIIPITAFIIIDVKNPNWGISSKVVTISPVLVTILTFLYVLITRNQLKQSKSDFNYSSKPLPWITEKQFYIEKPNLWVLPKNDNIKVKIFSRYVLKFNIKNIGNDPALSVDIKTTLKTMSLNKKTEVEYKSIDNHYSFLGKNMETTENIYFPLDFENNLINSFINKSNEYSFLDIEIYFRNYIGIIFKVTFSYILNCEKEETELINQLNKIIKNQKIKYHNTLLNIEKKITRHENYHKLINDIRESLDFDEDLIFTMNLIEIPNDNIVESIPYKKYEKIKKTFNTFNIIKGKSNHCSLNLLKNESI